MAFNVVPYPLGQLLIASIGRSGNASEFLSGEPYWHDLRRDNWRHVKQGHMPSWFSWIASFVSPCVDPVCLRMTFQEKHLYNSVPYSAAFERLGYWGHALQVASNATVEAVSYIS